MYPPRRRVGDREATLQLLPKPRGDQDVVVRPEGRDEEEEDERQCGVRARQVITEGGSP